MVRPSDAETELIVLSEPPPAPPPASARRLGRGLVVLAVLAVLALLVDSGIRWYGRHEAPERSADAPIAVESAAIVKTDMSTAESLPGTLGYGTARQVKGGRDGIVTWLPKPGSSVKRGKQLFRVDDQPVPLFYGGMPLFRTLQETGTAGRDVRIIATNLKALGYSIGTQPGAGETVTRTRPAPPSPTPSASAAPPGTVTTRVTVRKGEGVLTRSLIAAIKNWQQDTALPVTGRIGVGDVAVLPSAVRVDSVTAQLGDSAAAPLMSVTTTAKVITVTAELAQAGAIEQGDRVTVVLPDDKSVPGEVVAVGRVVQSGNGEAGDPNATPKLAVTVTVDDANTVARLDAAEVQVTFAAETRKGVLAVPIGALVALSEGGYAVQIAGGGLVAVETGLFAKGLVEVTGDGLAEGTNVVTTS